MPYAPTERYDFSPLVRGAAMFGAGVGDAIAGSRERDQEEEKRLRAEAQKFQGLVTYLANKTGKSKDFFTPMSIAELEGYGKSLVEAQLEEERQMRNAESLARIAATQEEINTTRSKLANEAARTSALSNYFSPAGGPPRPINYQSLQGLAQANPSVLGTEAYGDLLNVAKATAPADAPQTINTPWGEQILLAANQVVRKPKEEAPLQTRYSVSYDEMGMPREQIVGPLTDRENIRRMAGIQGEPAAVAEAPKDAKARKAGTVYQTPRGPLKWTGTGWVQP